MRRYFFPFFAFLFFININSFADDNQLKTVFDLAARAQNWFEGFGKNIGGNEFSYHSFRSDISASLLTRCTDGKMAIEWETELIPDGSAEQVGFLWVAALDLTSEKYIFDVFVNGQKRFELPSSQQKNWSIKSSDGGELLFVNIETDMHDDAHGYMAMLAPKSWLQKGKAQDIKIVGRANGSNTWLIVYQAADALDYLRSSIKHDVSMELAFEKSNGYLYGTIRAPFHLAGQTLTFSADGQTGSILLKQNDGYAEGNTKLSTSLLNKPFELNDQAGKLFTIQSLGEAFTSTRLLEKAVLTNECTVNSDKIYVSAKRRYAAKTVSGLLDLSDSKLAKGKIFLMNSSHQDIAWMDSPEKCVVERDTMLLAPLFERAQKDKSYRFDVEDALMIKEFIERHPEKKGVVKQMLNDGRLSCGSTFTQPYEEMYSGEALARQFYLGAKWLKDEFDYDANVYWNVDVPGRTPQMMQMMHKAGTQYMMISRHERGLYKWYSPDGSFVTVFSPGHYADAFTFLQKKFYDTAQYLATSSMDWEPYFIKSGAPPVIPLLSDWDMSPAKDYSHLIDQWHNITELEKDGAAVPIKLPEIKVASTPEFFDALMAAQPDLNSITGERPAVWLYIHGPSHQKAVKTSRAADILLTQAEKFATVNALVNGSFINYPETELQAAWEAKIYPDHGWGGKHGDITDARFFQKYEFAKTQAEHILHKNVNDLASKIKTHPKKGRPLVVFNSMGRERNDPVAVGVTFNESDAFSVELSDSDGKSINIQLNDIEKYNNGSIKKAQLHFIAEQVPSIGYKTYYLKSSKQKTAATEKVFTSSVENQYYKLTFGDGGLASIFDKELKKELVNSDKFVAGEIFTMHSEGNGAGEFSDIQQPDMRGFDKTGDYRTEWTIENDGPVFTTFTYRQPIKHAVVEQRIRLYHQMKKIDFDPALLNWEGELYREFRMALPLNMTDGEVAYEAPFSVVTVGQDEIEGAAGERYKTPCKEIHPRGIENWISARNDDFGVILSSSVVAADWIDPTDHPIDNQMLQPILLASRKSCHWEGNDYLQTGNHYFSFSMTSQKEGWKSSADFGRRSNEKLLAVWADNAFANASLPESKSFFSSDAENVLFSTIKKAEDSDDVVVRLVELEGRDKTITLSSFKKVGRVTLTNLIEKDVKDVDVNGSSVNYELRQSAIETLKLKIVSGSL